MKWPGTVPGGRDAVPVGRALSAAVTGEELPFCSLGRDMGLLYNFSPPAPMSRLTLGGRKVILEPRMRPASHTIEIRVRFGETDPYGVAYFAAILDYFKRGLDEFLRVRGLSPDAVYRNREKNFGFPIV